MAVFIPKFLRQLRDVLLTSPQDGDVLVYDAGAGKWENSAAAGGGSSTLAGLTDVTGGPPNTGEAPVWDGDSFELTDIATQTELASEASSRSSGDTAAVATAEAYTDSAVSALSSVYQPLDSDLTAIAALTTTSFGRAFLALADSSAARSAIGVVIGTDVEAHDTDLTTIAGLSASNDDFLQRKAGAWANRTVAQVLADLAVPGTTFQPLDADLTAIAALTTTSFGRAFLALADAAATRTAIGLVIGTDVEAHDSDLTTIAGLSPTNDDVVQRKAGAWANRSMAQLISDLAALGTTFQPLDATLTALAGANWAANTLAIGSGTDTVSQVSFAANTFPARAASGNLVAKTITDFGLSLVDDAAASNARTTLGLVIGTDVEAHDSDLTTIGGLSPSNDDFLQRKAGAWANRTVAQVKTDLGVTTPAWVQLFDSTLGSAGTFDLTSISQSYNHLKLMLKLRCNTGATKGDFALVTFNNDSGNNYNEQQSYGQDTTNSAVKSGAVARFAPTWSSAGSSLNANTFAIGSMDIVDYRGAHRKMATGLFGVWNDVDGYGTVASWLGQWMSNTAISRITLVPFSGTQFAIGSRVTLYGLL